MSQNKKSKAEISKELENHMSNLNEQYAGYVSRIEKRIQSGEKLEVKSFEMWIRKVTKTLDGNVIEIIVAGDSGETKNERFIRLGQARMKKTLYDMELLCNLANPQYEASPEQISSMLNALRIKILDIENSYKSQQQEIEMFKF